MFSAVIICATKERGRLLHSLVVDSGELEILRELDSIPSTFELHRLLNCVEPDLFLIDLAAGESAVQCGFAIHAQSPETGIIGLGGGGGEAGSGLVAAFSAVLPEGSRDNDLRLAVAKTMHAAKGGIEANLLSFVPAKAGSGASTLVFNTAAAIAGQFGRKVLVIDADLRSGIQAILLNATPSGTIENLLDAGSEINPSRWRDTVFEWHGVDFLLSSHLPAARLPLWKDYFYLLNFARSRYDAILVDLPELVNPATVEFVRRSRMVFTVCTCEIPSLKLTGQRCNELLQSGIPAEDMRVLLNRWHSKDLSLADAAAIIGHPALKSFPNDYPGVKDAIMNSRPVAIDSPLGQAFREFAAWILGAPVVPPPPAERPGKFRSWFTSGSHGPDRKLRPRG